MGQIKATKPKQTNRYAAFKRINGQHPLKQAVPSLYVGYSAQTRPDGKVYYFNFALAKEMGLIPKNHAEQMNPDLEEMLLDTFSLEIINEFDILNSKAVDKTKVKRHQYMATRYLQLQHPNKTGLTSGDGRAVWNGCFKGRNGVWDVSSGGTGATRLSPATAIQKTFFKTGDKNVSYGCGLATVREGIGTALTSDIFYRNGVKTERTLLVVGFKDGSAINVRAARNLLRPAHFFGLLRRNLHGDLKALVDYYIEREVENKQFPVCKTQHQAYHTFLDLLATRFASSTAILESEYIFCWLDWDGDNILTDSSIIDYGTIRQFGLFHHEYRYADVEKMSASITEQKNKAKDIIKTFAQLLDYVITGEKKHISQFNKHPVLDLFDETFTSTLLKHQLYRIGFDQKQQDLMMQDPATAELVARFQRQFRYFEKAVSGRRAHETADGLNRDAIFCMRDALRELPTQLLNTGEIYEPVEWIELIASYYASQKDKILYRKQKPRITKLQKTYIKLIQNCAFLTGKSEKSILKNVQQRSQLVNRYERVTGDALIHITERFMRQRNQLSFEQLFQAMEDFIQQQVLNPDFLNQYKPNHVQTKKQKTLLQTSKRLLKENREGL